MKKPKVSEHAILRYLERTGRLDRAAVEAEILTPDVVAAVSLGACGYKSRGLSFSIANNTIVTVIDDQGKRWLGRQNFGD